MNKDIQYSYTEKLNELKLESTHPKNKNKVFCCVEGNDDLKLFRKIFNTNNVKLEVIPGAKVNLIKIVKQEFANLNNFIGIVDADFDNILDIKYDRIFKTDYHDIEIGLILEDEVLFSVLNEYSKLSKTQILKLRDRIFSLLSKVSCLKYNNIKLELGLDFSNLSFVNLLDFDKDTLDYLNYLNRISNITNYDTSLFKEFTCEDVSMAQLTNGHDFIKVISLYVRDFDKKSKINEKTISSSLRIAFSLSYFKKTQIYSELVIWSHQNNFILFE